MSNTNCCDRNSGYSTVVSKSFGISIFWSPFCLLIANRPLELLVNPTRASYKFQEHKFANRLLELLENRTRASYKFQEHKIANRPLELLVNRTRASYKFQEHKIVLAN